ncbi:hypothetical protein CLD22_17745 [Rubrivivax gelatinosus]|nr:hypothetical protein [Rubrivivax gelatinosus]
MSKTRACTERRRRAPRGFALLESLVGMLVLSLAVIGSLLTLANGTRAQQVNNGRAEAIDRIRGQVVTQGLDLCGSELTLTVQASAAETSVSCRSYGNVTITLPGDNARSVTIADTDARIIDVTVDSPRVGGSLSLGASP